jgi:uncharacterized HAD superfamily protein
MAQLIVGLDLDDVLMDFNSALCLFHNARYGTSLKRADIASYHLEEIWGCSREEAIRRIKEFYYSSEHNEALPVSGAVEVVQALQTEVTFFVVTSRPNSVSIQTLQWVERHLAGLVREVYFTSHFMHEEGRTTKGEVCRKLEVSAFVDDAPFHVDEIASEVDKALLFDTPWNQNHKPKSGNIKRVHSWSEIHSILKGDPVI